MTPPIDLVALIAEAVAEKLSQQLPAATSFNLVGLEQACERLDVSADYFRKHIEPHVPVIFMPSAGKTREFKHWDVEDLRAFVGQMKRTPGKEGVN